MKRPEGSDAFAACIQLEGERTTVTLELASTQQLTAAPDVLHETFRSQQRRRSPSLPRVLRRLDRKIRSPRRSSAHGVASALERPEERAWSRDPDTPLASRTRLALAIAP